MERRATRPRFTAPGVPAAVSALVMLGACAHSVPLMSAGSPPEVAGRIEVVERDHGVRVVRLSVEKLGARADAGARTHVVWSRGQRDVIQNLGALRVQDESGVMEAVIPADDRLQIFITLERSDDVERPSRAPLYVAEIRKE